MKNLLWCVLLAALSHPLSGAESPRLVVLAPNLVELLYSMGAGDQIVATTDFADYPEAAKQLPRVGNFQSIQLEKIVALKPDYVLYWQSGSRAGDIDSLHRLGIKTQGFEPRVPSDLIGMLKQLGVISGKTAAANDLALQVKRRLAEISRRYQQQRQIPVFYEIWHEPLTTIGTNDWPAQALTLCGAVSVPTLPTPYPQLSVEVLLLHPPTLIIQPTSVNEPRSHVDFSRWPSLAQVPVVKADADKLHRATLRTLDGIEQLCQQIELHRQRLARTSH